MAPHILFIGASGHIGAAVLQAVKAAYPDLSIDALVRSEDDGHHIQQLYQSTVTTIRGSLSDLSSVEAAASRAQIVINCAPDVIHSAGIAALLRGISTSPYSRKFYIHTSGAARIWDAPDGNEPGRIWDDIADFDSLPPDNTHAETDMQVTAANSDVLHTAIISPCFVIGRTPSRTHTPPITFPDWMHVIRQVGGVFTVQAGKNVTAFVDTEALAGLYAALVGDALVVLNGEKGVHGDIWGPRAYYFAASLEASLAEFNQRWLVPALKRCGGEALLGDGEVKELTVERVTQVIMGRLGDGVAAGLWSRHIAEGFGTSMRVRGTRATRFLGYQWVDDLPGLDDAVRATLDEI